MLCSIAPPAAAGCQNAYRLRARPCAALPLRSTDAPLQMSGYKGALLKAFLQMMLSETGQAEVAQFEFAALPKRLLDVAKAGVNAITVTGDQTPGPWIFEAETGANSYAVNSTSTNAMGLLGTNKGWVGTGLGQAASTISVNRLSWATYQRNYNSLNVSILQARRNCLRMQQPIGCM